MTTEKDRINEIIQREGGDILQSERFQRARTIPHHKYTNVAEHSLAVTEWAVHLYEQRDYPDTDVRDVVRACLLHDIGMTDPEIHDSVSFLKAYSHPERSALIAAREYNANEVQLHAIRHHMWPVCVIPPDSPVGWLLLRADKHCTRSDALRFLDITFRGQQP